jgi:hypothetical protein
VLTGSLASQLCEQCSAALPKGVVPTSVLASSDALQELRVSEVPELLGNCRGGETGHLDDISCSRLPVLARRDRASHFEPVVSAEEALRTFLNRLFHPPPVLRGPLASLPKLPRCGNSEIRQQSNSSGGGPSGQKEGRDGSIRALPTGGPP